MVVGGGLPRLIAAEAHDVETDPLVLKKLETFQDWKFGFMMHWGIYSQWGCDRIVAAGRGRQMGPARRSAGLDRARQGHEAVRRRLRQAQPNFQSPPLRSAALGRRRETGRHEIRGVHHQAPRRLLPVRHAADRLPHDPPLLSFPHRSPRRRGQGRIRRRSARKASASGPTTPRAIGISRATGTPPGRTSRETRTTTRPRSRSVGRRFVNFTHHIIEELVSGYGPIDILWLDGGQVRPPQQDINMPAIAAMARRHQPGLIIVDRIGRRPL